MPYINTQDRASSGGVYRRPTRTLVARHLNSDFSSFEGRAVGKRTDVVHKVARSLGPAARQPVGAWMRMWSDQGLFHQTYDKSVNPRMSTSARPGEHGRSFDD